MGYADDWRNCWPRGAQSYREAWRRMEAGEGRRRIGRLRETHIPSNCPSDGISIGRDATVCSPDPGGNFVSNALVTRGRRC